jgi:hypothetical protein
MKPFRLSRRACLRGAGVALALPALEIMEPRSARAQALNPLRFLCVYSPNGFLMDKWTPTGLGTTYTSSPLLAPLDAYRNDFNVISGLGNYTASLTNIFGGSHTRATGSLLTQCPIASPDTGDDIQNGISLDQIIAAEIGDQTRFPSIQVGARASSLTGNCEDSFSCAYNNNISWSGPSTPLVKQVNPRDIFDRLFADLPMDGDPMMPAPTNNKALYQKSILDVVMGRTETLKGKLGKTDRAKLEEYLNAVREVEMQIARLVDGGVVGRECTIGEPPKDSMDGEIPYGEHLDLISDMIALAFQCDVTRVGTYMFEHSFSDVRSFDFIPGVTARHHEITHGDEADQEELINNFYVARFSYLLGKLKAATEGDSNVLDNSIVYFTSEFGNAHAHDHRGLAMLVAGKAGGKFKTGQHVVYPLAPGDGEGVDGRGHRDDTQLAHLHLTTLHAFDIAQASYGKDENGEPMAITTLPEIVA